MLQADRKTEKHNNNNNLDKKLDNFVNSQIHMTLKKLVQFLKHLNTALCSENETYMKTFTSSWTCETPDRLTVRPVGNTGWPTVAHPSGRAAVGYYIEPNRMEVESLPAGIKFKIRQANRLVTVSTIYSATFPDALL